MVQAQKNINHFIEINVIVLLSSVNLLVLLATQLVLSKKIVENLHYMTFIYKSDSIKYL